MSNQARIDNLTWSRADVKRYAQSLKGRLDELIRDMDQGYARPNYPRTSTVF